MDRIVALGQLMDYYGSVLTERKYHLVSQYVYEDLSLREISEREKISRQAVHDAVATAEAELQEMENRVGMIRKSRMILDILQELRGETEDPGMLDKLERIQRILEE